MNRFKELYKSYNNPLNDIHQQSRLVQEALYSKQITINEAIDIMFGKDLIQDQFDKDLKDILND